MLPVAECEILDRMQTGEVERAVSVEEEEEEEEETPPPHTTMTVTQGDGARPRSLPPPPPLISVHDYKFKRESESPAPEASDGERGSPRPMPECREQSPNESVRSWLQRITAMQNEIQRKQQRSSEQPLPAPQPQPQPARPANNASRVVKYQDLPYMGEMTLDNSKPRRGRKPKKADICHLIYKNYGTIFPGTPRGLVDGGNAAEGRRSSAAGKAAAATPPAAEAAARTNVQNRIISSLLERRLTQESLRGRAAAAAVQPAGSQDEPLNLCIRDLNQLKIRLLRRHDDVYTPDSIKTEPASATGDDDDDDDVKVVADSPPTAAAPLLEASNIPPVANSAAGGYVYWPSGGVFIHPMALHSQLMYYQQRMAAAAAATTSGDYTLPTPVPLADSPTVVREPSESVTPPSPAGGREYRRLVPKHLERAPPEPQSPGEEVEVSSPTVAKRGAAHPASAPTKRKRSAIFIPPIPAENQTNPATEVSICKFRFTGGAKPSLQEKKMLSVDSGGNFRYYSGTGDKSMRGYEFFPLKALQQQAAASGAHHGSGSGAFLHASGERIPHPPELMFGDPAAAAAPGAAATLPAAQPPAPAPTPLLSPGAGDAARQHRKRKTRKSIQREKLEQTFKEKGFLIQTQQLESAEGATYCKFRQLRKFTRYLFRSWKDYLPGSVRDMHEDADRSDDDDDTGAEDQPLAC